ncbi:hypothetical protein F511_37498 [Dorcoceras hygrometricum]|uniref:Uncharacterized protein n=1 Tax=Dorcoceras hygrometricum TaxID=472368 RepID=A0A2Z7BTF9_9LAMI|nr:hypothetical protein F511_37498 [Dorcoceras hygrometricum]
MSQTDNQENQLVAIELVGFELVIVKLIDTISIWSVSRYSVMLSWGLPHVFPADISNLNGRDWVSFTSVLAMEHAGMVRMFKALEDTGLRGFFRRIVSTVSGKNLVVTEESFLRTFKLPTAGMQNLSGIPNETIAEMRNRFSATTVPFKSSGKKKDLLFEYRLLHDIVAKSLCEKSGLIGSMLFEKQLQEFRMGGGLNELLVF